MRQKTFINLHSASPAFLSVSKHSPEAQMHFFHCLLCTLLAFFLPSDTFCSFHVEVKALVTLMSSAQPWRKSWERLNTAVYIWSTVTWHIIAFFQSKTVLKSQIISHLFLPDKINWTDVFCIRRCFSWGQKVPIHFTWITAIVSELFSIWTPIVFIKF